MVTAIELRKRIESWGTLKAAASCKPDIATQDAANVFIFQYVHSLLLSRKFVSAAIVLWGTRVFDPRPECVQKVWRGINKSAKVLLMGAGSLGKSYSGIVWILLSWLQDTEYTTIKIISTTAGHAHKNTFSTLVRLWKRACIPLPGIVTSGYLGMDTAEKKSGIDIIAIPEGDDGKGRLKGFHPDPRPTPHPILGANSRVMLFMDECEDAPEGLWEGVDNMLLSQNSENSIKVIGAYNPKDQTSKTAQNAEPVEGWDSFDVETGVNGKDEWLSKNGWWVTRLDGRKTENVREQREVYPGFLTYQGYRDLEDKNGGDSPEYYTLGRGAYPPEGVNAAIITPAIMRRSRGTFLFLGTPTNFGGVDIAVDGRDNCCFANGRAGLATAFKHRDGQLVKFQVPRHALQIDQLFYCKKGDTKIVGDDIIKHMRRLHIDPENLCVDRTGNGAAVWAYICALTGSDVMGVDFSEAASNNPILAEDLVMPVDLYEGIVTEVWYALKFWMEFGFVAISPGIAADPLEGQLLGRRYQQGLGKKIRVEKKDDYKDRNNNRSPDEADAVTIINHGARQRINAVVKMLPDAKKPKPGNIKKGVVDKVQWMN